MSIQNWLLKCILWKRNSRSTCFWHCLTLPITLWIWLRVTVLLAVSAESNYWLQHQWRSQVFFHGGAVGWQLKMMGWLPLAIKARIGIASRTHDNWAIEQLNKILKVVRCVMTSLTWQQSHHWHVLTCLNSVTEERSKSHSPKIVVVSEFTNIFS